MGESLMKINVREKWYVINKFDLILELYDKIHDISFSLADIFSYHFL